jgi:hypothetical protein
MFKIKGFLMTLLLVLMIIAAPITGQAATQNYPDVINGIQMAPFQISGQWTATTTSVVRVQIPFKAQVLGVSATARASGGTSPTLTVDVLEAGTTILSSPISITAGTVSEGTISDSSLADESAITINLAIGGTSPTWNDITVILTLRRTN